MPRSLVLVLLASAASSLDVLVLETTGGTNPFASGQAPSSQFFLPLNEEKLLLTCGQDGEEFHLFGRAMGIGASLNHQQWFDRFRIVNKEDDREQLEVSIAKNASQPVDMTLAKQAEDDGGIDDTDDRNYAVQLNTLYVTVDGMPLTHTGALGTEQGNLVAVWATSGTETVQMSSGNAVMQIKSAISQASPDGKKHQLYTHLDITFQEIAPEECTAGILAEIWGVIPMTQDTSKLQQPPGQPHGEPQ